MCNRLACFGHHLVPNKSCLLCVVYDLSYLILSVHDSNISVISHTFIFLTFFSPCRSFVDCTKLRSRLTLVNYCLGATRLKQSQLRKVGTHFLLFLPTVLCNICRHTVWYIPVPYSDNMQAPLFKTMVNLYIKKTKS